MELSQHQDNDDVMKFECGPFSCFPESETLFFGGDTVLRINGIMQWAQGKWMQYHKLMEPINAFIRMFGGFPVSIQSNKRHQKFMKYIIRDGIRSLIGLGFECQTPKYIQDLFLFHRSTASQVQLIYDELVAEYEWLHCILKKPPSDQDTLNIANIGLLFSDSESITFLMADGYTLSDLQCASLMGDLVLMSEMGLL